MLRTFVNRIVELAAPTTYEIDGRTYASEHLDLIEPPKHKPVSIDVTGLDSICKLVRNEAKAVGRKIFIQIEKYNRVTVFSTYDEEYERSWLYRCVADTPIVRMFMEIGAKADIYAQYDMSDEWVHVCTIRGTDLRSFSIPIRPRRCDYMKMKIVGEGMTKIYSITKTTEQGSDLS